MPDPETVDPANPESSPGATMRLTIGPPADPNSTQQLDLSIHREAPRSLKPSGTAPTETQKLIVPLAGDPPIRTQKSGQPSQTAGRTQNLPLRPKAPRPLGGKLLLALGLLVVLGVAGYLVFSRSSAPHSPLPPVVAAPESVVPPGAQAYIEQARAGDAHAMRMLGVMYYYGLNVPQDREKGLHWYRKAAEKGSTAAQAELAKLETTGK